MKIPAFIVYTVALFCPPLFAQHSHSQGEDKGSYSHSEKKHHHDDGHGHDLDLGHHVTIIVPEGPADLWAHINAYSKVVTESAAAGDIETLHKEQINLEALVVELSHTLPMLDQNKRKRVEGMVNNVKRALKQLHTATDAKDQAGISKQGKSLNGVLALLKAQYPKTLTSGMAEVKDDLGQHHGILQEFTDDSGKVIGIIELKLHDDKGDLELWIVKDSGNTQPFDIDSTTPIKLSFSDAGKATAMLAVRNLQKNEDENGVANMRNGKTNYFIYPGSSGESADWLKGKQFKSMVTVEFAGYRTAPFLLIPHRH